MEPTIDQIIRWALEFENASGQIQKAYDWNIAQWSAMATAFLTGLLAVSSNTLLEYYKKTALAPYWKILLGLNVFVYLCAYVLCRVKIRRLRREFLALYTLLLAVK